MNWAKHFQAVSSGAASTAQFGVVIEGCFGDDAAPPGGYAGSASEKVQPFVTPALVGVAVGVASKLAGLLGPTPIVLGLAAFGVGTALNLSKAKAATPPDPALAAAPTSGGYAPTVTRPGPAATTTPFVGPVQQLPAAAPTKPWKVLVPLTKGGFVMTVADVQDALNDLGFANPFLVVDGNAGGPSSKTTAAVKRAQAQYHLRVTGSTADGNLKLALQKAVVDKAGFKEATARADALAKSMGYS